MLNKVMLIGNLGKDPEVRHTQSGDPVANLTVATSEKWKDKQGERQEKTEWHRVVLFGKLAEIAEKYLFKGSKVYIEGQLQTRKWVAQDGTEKYTTEVKVAGFGGELKMLDSKGANGASRAPAQNDVPSMGGGAPAMGGGQAEVLDDEIPF